MHLPDINIWLALAFDFHIHHQPALDWFDAQPPTSCAFCRMTQQGFLRLATNPKVLGTEAVSLADAWKFYDNLLNDPRVLYADETPGLEQLWRQYTARRTFSPKVWNDAYLAAFAETAQLEFVTFDQAFTQYQLTRCTILPAQPTP